MIDQHEIKEPNLIPSFKEDISDKSRIDDFSEIREVGHVEIKIITHIEDFEALEQEWKKLARDSNTHIFQTFEWNRIWWKHFGATKKLHIVAVYAGTTLAGIAPLFEDEVTLFGRKVYSCLRLLGSYVSQPEGEPLIGCISYSDYLDCIIHPEHEKIFYQSILQHFSEIDSAFNEIILDEVSENSSLYKTMLPLIAMCNYGLSYKINQASSSPVILLNSTWKTYLNTMSKRARSTARRYYKRSRPGDSKVFKIKKLMHAGELPRVLNDFFQMHQQQWNNRGFAGTFSEKRMRTFFSEIATSFYEKDWIEFNMAVPVDTAAKNVAIDVLITYKNRVYLMHRGMDENPLYRKQGPGNVLLYARLHKAINDGVEVFDMLRGSEEFKLRMASEINQNKKIIVGSNNKKGRMLPGLVKKYLNFIRYVRMEELHIIIVFKGRSFFRGITDYLQFQYRRIHHKSYK